MNTEPINRTYKYKNAGIKFGESDHVYLLFVFTPIRNILSRFSDKWSLLVLYTLSMQPTMRVNALRHGIPDISQKMLTNTLRTLQEDGFVTRKIYAEVPPRVEYSITDRARSLFPHIDSLIGWAKPICRQSSSTARATRSIRNPGVDEIYNREEGCGFIILEF